MALVDIRLRASDEELATFGVAALVIFGLFGGLIYWFGGLPVWSFPDAAPTVAVVLLSIAGASGLLSVVAPRANGPLFVALATAAYPIGIAVSYALLAVLFYGMMMPLGVLFRLIGRDALRRRLEPEAASYWIERAAAPPAKRYFKQF